MQEIPTHPTNIEKKSDQTMSITWNNGEKTVVAFTKLRFYCRCAECVDEWTRKRTITAEKIPPDVHPKHIEPVGRYAIQINWSDGHKTGIYSFEHLYKIAKGTEQ